MIRKESCEMRKFVEKEKDWMPLPIFEKAHDTLLAGAGEQHSASSQAQGLVAHIQRGLEE